MHARFLRLTAFLILFEFTGAVNAQSTMQVPGYKGFWKISNIQQEQKKSLKVPNHLLQHEGDGLPATKSFRAQNKITATLEQKGFFFNQTGVLTNIRKRSCKRGKRAGKSEYQDFRPQSQATFLTYGCTAAAGCLGLLVLYNRVFK